MTDEIEPARILASTAEREAVAAWLGFAFQEGRLDLAEYDRRVAAAYRAQARGELEALTVDLPKPTRPVPAASNPEPSPFAGPDALVRMTQRRYLLSLVVAAMTGGLIANVAGSVLWLLLVLGVVGGFGFMGWVFWDPYGHRGRSD